MKLSFRTKVNAGFFPALMALILISVFAAHNTELLVQNASMVSHTHEVLQTTERLLSWLKDMETGQRGYILTGQDDYLQPYLNASARLDQTFERLNDLTSSNESQQRRAARIRELADDKMEMLKNTIRLRKEKGLDAALTVIKKNEGKATMDQIRSIANDMRAEENRILIARNASVDESTNLTMGVVIGGGILSIALLLAATFVVNLAENERIRVNRTLESQNKMRGGLLTLSEIMAGEQSLADLTKNVLSTLANFIGASVGALYLADETNTFKRVSTFAVRDEDRIQSEFKSGEGLVGEVALQKKPLYIADPPKNYLKISSALGGAEPKSLALFPFLFKDEVKGVAEFATLSAVSEPDNEFMSLALQSAAVALNSAQIRTQIAELLQETQTQAEELQAQQEELRTANEELQQKTNEMETQQEELRQTNEELEEQKSALEGSNQELEAARLQNEERAREIEQASKYKSEFLANMSHELRTPLNSILLLSQSLAENTETNLTNEQQEFAKTIHSSGTDLLSLINDILDLSKVEAGKLNIQPGEISISDIAEAMKRGFGHAMKNKNLSFVLKISDHIPKTIVSDRLRLEQILKNFLSNALKFTEQGSVTLSFDRPDSNTLLSTSGLEAGSSIAISVQDTGVGIPENKKKKVFEAFEQVDGAASRKFGGAGLGLSIAKQLAQLLGGEIHIESVLNQGSTFTLIVPDQFTQRESIPVPVNTVKRSHVTEKVSAYRNNKRVLVVEDKQIERNNILKLIGSEKVSAVGVGSATEALTSLKSETFDCMILDLKLPDISGFELLRRMEMDRSVSRCPVVVYTGRDLTSSELDQLRHFSQSIIIKGVHSQERLMDEVGMFLREVKTEPEATEKRKPIETVRHRDEVFSGKKVLIVDDDMRNVFALRSIFQKKGFDTLVAKTGKEAVAAVKANPQLDAVLMDIMMPEMDGYEATRLIRSDERFAKLPIIALTAKAMSSDREKCLAAGASDYLAKPIDMDSLLNLLRVWLTK
jgi:two-component system chemotaxis sensor kinase CheA